jgi:hypothetical protein
VDWTDRQRPYHSHDESCDHSEQGRAVANTFVVGRSHKFSPQAQVMGSLEQETDCGKPNPDMQGTHQTRKGLSPHFEHNQRVKLLELGMRRIFQEGMYCL